MKKIHFFKVVTYFLLLEIYFMSNSVLCRGYTTYTMMAKEICHPFGKKQKLSRKLTDEYSGIIVTPGHKFDNWEPILDSNCHFVIETKDKPDGVFAVIQNMNLRSRNGECLDYVKFRKGEDGYSEPLCGQFQRHNFISMQGNHENKLLHSSYDPHGKIDTKIFVSMEPFETNFIPNITIAYTLFQDCRKVDSNYYKPVVKGKNICILNDYFCDGIYNCGGMNGCLDEENCTDPTSIVNSGTGTKITIAVVTILFLCLITFLMYLWICRKQKKLCWSSDYAGQTQTQTQTQIQNASNFNLMLNINQSNAASQMIPVAPMIDEPMPPSAHEKDLPPSYDSLYPSNSSVTPL